MLHNGKSDATTLNEVIEDNVKKLLKKVQIKDIANFVIDCTLHHKSYPRGGNTSDRRKLR